MLGSAHAGPSGLFTRLWDGPPHPICFIHHVRIYLLFLAAAVLLPLRAAIPTLWIAGDSTVKSNAPQRGWGQELGAFFDPAKLHIANRAIGGRSARTFFTEGRWQQILEAVQPGDFVIIQFGHNDVGPLGEKGKFRGSLKGIGEETEAVAKPDGSSEVVRTYGWYLREMARSARGKKATVILCSPVPHKKFAGDWQQQRSWVKACARAEGVAYIDLAGRITSAYATLDAATLEGFFADKDTHTSPAGARFNAEAVLAGLRALPGAPLAGFQSASR